MKAKNKAISERLSSSAISAVVIASIIVFNIILFTLVETFSLYLYSEEQLDFSLAGDMSETFEEARLYKKKVKISFCMAEDELKNDDIGSFVYQTAKNYEEKYPEVIELDYVNVITRRNKDGEFVDLKRFTEDKNGNKYLISQSSVIFECGDNWRVVTDSSSSAGFVDFFTLDSSGSVSSYNGEEVMAGMICWVLADEHKKAYFTEKHGEVADVSLSNLLACAGYYVDIIDLRRNEVPKDCDLLIISNPRSDFEQASPGSGVRSEIERVRTYLEGDGNLFVSIDPYIKKNLTVLESFLAEWGITLSTTKTDKGEFKNIVNDPFNAITTNEVTVIADYADSPLALKMKEKTESVTDGGIILSHVSALTLSKDAKPLLMSSSSAELYANGEVVDSEGSYCISAYAERENEDGVSTVFVIPSVYLAVSDTLVSRGYSNKDFLYALFDMFYGADSMPYGCRAILLDTTTLENLRLGTAKIYTAIIMAVPLAIACTGAVVIIKRKHR